MILEQVVYTAAAIPIIFWNAENYRCMHRSAPWWERWGHILMGSGTFGATIEWWWRAADELGSHSFNLLAVVGLAMLCTGFIFRRKPRARGS